MLSIYNEGCLVSVCVCMRVCVCVFWKKKWNFVGSLCIAIDYSFQMLFQTKKKKRESVCVCVCVVCFWVEKNIIWGNYKHLKKKKKNKKNKTKHTGNEKNAKMRGNCRAVCVVFVWTVRPNVSGVSNILHGFWLK